MNEFREYTPNIVELNPGFKERLKQILEGLQKTPLEDVQFLPSYEIDSNIGKLKIDVMGHDTGKSFTKREVYFFLVKNETGQIIATRSCSIFPPHGGYSHLSADIQIGQKDKGLATPVDLVFMQGLQQLANQKQTRIKWTIQNMNQEKLDEKKSELKEKFDMSEEDLINNEEIKALEIEQQRWQKLYGPDSKLGIKEANNFYPDTENEVEKIDNIILEKFEDPQTKTTSAKIVETNYIKNVEVTKKERQERLIKDIQTNLEFIAS